MEKLARCIVILNSIQNHAYMPIKTVTANH